MDAWRIAGGTGQTSRVNGVNTYDYLTALFTALPLARTPDDYEALLPWRIKLPTA